jgi:UDP-2,3-diacylglucosamine pyrophosphatase LpxH
MRNTVSRRKFVGSLGMLAAALPLGASAFDFIPSAGKGFNFVLLGDLHFDKLEHHDMAYIHAKYPNDLEQIKNYSRITRDNFPLLMQEVKRKGTALNADFYLQLGDFVEGLCGSEALAQQQTSELIAAVADQQLGRPFLVIKGNHDITGEGAPQTYIKTVLPWQSKEHKQESSGANATFVHKNARFILFDAYAPDESLEWLKKVLAAHKEELLFFNIHMPVVPFNARSNWHIFAKATQQQKREELLNLLGKHKAIVLCGHLHKTSILKRSTPSGDFVQVCIGSVVPAPEAAVKDHLQGIDAYNADLVNLEPKFTPASLQERRDNLTNEKPYIKHFEYADFCGHATVSVTEKNEATISIHANVDKDPWTTVNLTQLLKG